MTYTKTTTAKSHVNRLKYRKTTDPNFSPKYLEIYATAKNRSPLPIMDAMTKVRRSMRKSPAAMVNILYGIGVKAAVKIARKAFWLKNSDTRTSSSSR